MPPRSPRPPSRTALASSLLLLAIAADARAGGAGALCALDETPLLSSTPNVGDRYGLDVRFDGATAAVGAYLDDGVVADSGAVHLQRFDGVGWTHEAKVVAADGAAQDRFGLSVAIDGSTLLVGAPWDDAAGTDSGSVYVFVRNGSQWTQQAKLVPADLAHDQHLGISVALDGDTAALGINDVPGAVYVYVRSGAQWTLQRKLTVPSPNILGSEVALDGDTLLASDTGDSQFGPQAGAAYVFVRAGGAWTQQAKLGAPDGDASFWDLFGSSLAIDGDLAVVGAAWDDQAGTNAGAAYAFERSGSSWAYGGKLLPGGAAAGDGIGQSVAVDAGRILVGAPGDDSAGDSAGAAYAFGAGDGGWSVRGKLVPATTGPAAGAGQGVALRGDVALLGGPTQGLGGPPGRAWALRLSACAEPFCAGDGSLATACPCANWGQLGRGCENSAGTGGALLAMAGNTFPDTAQLSSSGELVQSLSIFLQSPGPVGAGAPFGDGVRCVASPLSRLYVKHAAGGVAVAPVAGDPSITARSAALGDPIAPGSVRYYQVYYRDPSLAFCPGPQGATFNASSGLAIRW